MITQFNLYENKIIKKDIPKWFFLVLNIYKNNLGESLRNMEFLFLKGISDDISICNSFFDIRDMFLIMDGSEVNKLNDIIPLEYFNPDFLCKDNFKYFRRILQDEPQFQSNKYNITHDITFSMLTDKIFQNLGIRIINKRDDHGYNTRRIKDKNGVTKYIELCQYKLSENLNALYHLGRLHINSLDDFVKILLETLKEIVNSDIRLSLDYPYHKIHVNNNHPYYNLLDKEEYIRTKLTLAELKRLIRPVFTYYSKIYSHEGEWYNTSKSFKIPKNSILYFKESNRWNGFSKEKIDEFVAKYGLNYIYQIKTVANHEELFTILSNEYEN